MERPTNENLILEELREILKKITNLLRVGEEAEAISNLEQAHRLVEHSNVQISDGSLLIGLANNAWQARQFELAIYFARLSVDISKQKPEKPDPIIQGYVFAGIALRSLNRFEEAIKEFEMAGEAVECAAKSFLLFQYHINYGVVLKDVERLEEALMQYRLAENYADQASDEFRAILKLNIGAILHATGSLQEAIVMFKDAASNLSVELKPGAIANLANTLRDNNEPEEAMKHYQEAIDLIKGKDPRLEGQIYTNMGKAAIQMGLSREAANYLMLGLRARRQANDLLGQAYTLDDIARFLFSQLKPETALPYAREAVAILAKLQHPRLEEAHKLVDAICLFTEQFADTQELLVNALLSFLNAKDWKIRKSILQRNPALLEKETDGMFDRLLKDYADESDFIANLQECRGVLERCRNEGIETVFGELLQADQGLRDLVIKLAQIDSWSQWHRFVTDNSETLLSTEADKVLEFMMINARAEGDEVAYSVFSDQRRLLTRCREVGIETAFSERIQEAKDYDGVMNVVIGLLNKAEWIGRKRYVEANFSTLTESRANKAFEQLLHKYASDEVAFAHVKANRDLIRHCQETDIDLAFALVPPESLFDLIGRFVNVGNWSESKQLLELYKEQLLSAEVDRILEQTLQSSQSSPGNNSRIELHREVLNNCRKHGIDETFATLPAIKMTTYVVDTSSDPGEPTQTDEPIKKIKELESFIAVLRKTGEGLLLGSLLNKLGIAYQNLEIGSRKQNIEKAIDLYQEAISLIVPDLHPQNFSRFQHNLGSAYWELANLIPEEREENLKRAIEFYYQAMEIQKPEFMPEECRQSSAHLYEALISLQWGSDSDGYVEMMADVCLKAMQATDVLGRTGELESQRQEVERGAWAYSGAVQSLYQLRRYGTALEACERGKGRSFLTQVCQSDNSIPQNVPIELIDREREARRKLIETRQQYANRSEALGPDDDLEREIALRKANAQLDATYDEIGKYAANYAELKRGKPPRLEEILTFTGMQPDDSVFLQWYVNDRRTYLFCLEAGKKSVASFELPIGNEHLLDYLELLEEDIWKRPSDVGQQLSPAWQSLTETLFPKEIQRTIERSSRITLIAHGLLHLLPLHAFPLSHLNNQPLLALMPVHYLPSLAIGQRLMNRANTGKEDVFALAWAGERPMGSKGVTASALEVEAQAVAAKFGREALVKAKATPSQLCQHAPHNRVLHIACHAFYDADSPMASGLVLAPEEAGAKNTIFTAEDIVRSLQLPGSLVVLSACETGRSDVSTGDELDGLVRALFVAGARDIVASQWRVDMVSTVGFMIEFYNHYISGGSVAMALRDASLALRRRPETRHPFYWSPFITYGIESSLSQSLN